MTDRHDDEGPVEIAIVGDLTDSEAELTDRLLGVEPGGECTIYFDSPGGSPYCAVSLMTLIKLRRLKATGIVTGECSSATLWPFAACQRRIVTPFSVMLFHPMRWQSEENVGLAEASEWARHFGQLEQDMDVLLAELFGVPADRCASGLSLAATFPVANWPMPAWPNSSSSTDLIWSRSRRRGTGNTSALARTAKAAAQIQRPAKAPLRRRRR